jgi:lipopolysaccharide export system protein LptA
MTREHARGKLIVAVLLALLGASSLHAQPSSGPPNALQGFSQNRGKPINIHSATLEVRDKDKVATFAGDVHLVQGDTTLRSKTLVVFYEDDPAKPNASGGQGSQQSNQQIRRVEAKGGVIVVQKDQTATGDNGVFDMHANTVTLLGNVVISQGPNVVKGDRLTVDMTTGVSRVECERPGQCRVQALIQPGTMKQPEGRTPEGRTPEGRTPEPFGHEPPRQRGSQPSGIY